MARGSPGNGLGISSEALKAGTLVTVEIGGVLITLEGLCPCKPSTMPFSSYARQSRSCHGWAWRIVLLDLLKVCWSTQPCSHRLVHITPTSPHASLQQLHLNWGSSIVEI